METQSTTCRFIMFARIHAMGCPPPLIPTSNFALGSHPHELPRSYSSHPILLFGYFTELHSVYYDENCTCTLLTSAQLECFWAQDQNTSKEQENGSQTDDLHTPEKPTEDNIEEGKKQSEVELSEKKE